MYPREPGAKTRLPVRQKFHCEAPVRSGRPSNHMARRALHLYPGGRAALVFPANPARSRTWLARFSSPFLLEFVFCCVVAPRRSGRRQRGGPIASASIFGKSSLAEDLLPEGGRANSATNPTRKRGDLQFPRLRFGLVPFCPTDLSAGPRSPESVRRPAASAMSQPAPSPA
jgi:hypothetical protein